MAVIDRIEAERIPVKGVYHRILWLRKRKLVGDGFVERKVDHYQMVTWEDDQAIREDTD